MDYLSILRIDLFSENLTAIFAMTEIKMMLLVMYSYKIELRKYVKKFSKNHLDLKINTFLNYKKKKKD